MGASAASPSATIGRRTSTCCAAPTSRCTPRRAPTAGVTSTIRSSTSATARGSRRSRSSTPRSTATSSCCTISRRSTSRPAPPSARRRSCAGSTRPAACSPRTRSCPLAEQSGLMAPLTDVVLEAAVGRSPPGAQTGSTSASSVNLSASDLLDPTCPRTDRRPCSTARPPGRRARLEITESAIMADPERARDGARASCAGSGCESRSTTTAPATARWPTCGTSRSTSSSSTGLRGATSRTEPAARRSSAHHRARPRARPAGRRRRRRGPGDPRRGRGLRLRLRPGLLLQPSRPGGRVRRGNPPRGDRSGRSSLPPRLLAPARADRSPAGGHTDRRSLFVSDSRRRLLAASRFSFVSSR